MSVETKIKDIVKKRMRLPYLYASWHSANQELSELAANNDAHFPMCINVTPVDGVLSAANGTFKDAPNCLIAFCDEISLDAKQSTEAGKVERLKELARAFIATANDSGYFKTIAGDIRYTVSFARFNRCLVVVSLEMPMAEVSGVCQDDYIKRERCKTSGK